MLANPSFRDCLLRIGRVIPSFSLVQHYQEQSSFKLIIKNPSDIVQESLDDATATNEATERIGMLPWPRRLRLFTFMQNSPFILKHQIKEQMTKQKHLGAVEKPVRVGVLDMRWFFRNRKTFVTFSQELQGVPNRFYSS